MILTNDSCPVPDFASIGAIAHDSGRGKMVLPLLMALLLLMVGESIAGDEIQIRKCLVLPRPGRSGRGLPRPDPVEARMVGGTWGVPCAGEEVVDINGGKQTWTPAEADKDGWFTNEAFRGGYASVPVVVSSNCVMLLRAVGHGMVYVNGEPRAGDVYETGYVVTPIPLRAGTNELLFLAGRGRMRATLTPTAPALSFNPGDATLPDLFLGEKNEAWAGVVLVNATDRAMDQLHMRSVLGSSKGVDTVLPCIPPFSSRKVPVRLGGKAPATGDAIPVNLTVHEGKGGRALASETVQLRLRLPSQVHKRTFLSEVDGSVQYWALNPGTFTRSSNLKAVGTACEGEVGPAIFLSLHGASVEALGQADACSPKSWGHIVAPTNRRPYGFDWEGWGRLDAMEVLALAKRQLWHDPSRVYLTGHSMGGHGTWHLGALFPDQFAAIGPSAGWISFLSYAGGGRPTNATPAELLIQRASGVSDTLALETNYLHEGVYILHGDADDNVPVTEARTMREHLGTFHRDWDWFEQPGAGHWWDASDESGTDCVDWAPMFDFFGRHRIPSDSAVRQIRFTTANPGVSARSHWLTVVQQQHPLLPSRADIRCDPGQRRFSGGTENIAMLRLDVGHLTPTAPLRVDLDGQKLEGLAWPKSGVLWLQHGQDKWIPTNCPSLSQKNPVRSGPFKDGFRHRMIFVYGTTGSAAEIGWAKAKARFDAETFWYRGNGAVDVVADTTFDPARDVDRGVVLYGNRDSNSAWDRLLGGSPVQVGRGEVSIGGTKYSGENLACLFIRPRPGSAVACVAAVSGTGVVGMRLADRLPIFQSGMEYPDCTVFSTDRFTKPGKGVVAAGFFGNDWGVESGDFVMGK